MADIERQPNRQSLWAAILTAVMAVISLAMAITTLPRSGPYCRSGCVGYPYTDAAAYVPRDYLWMYPAIVLTLLAMALMECIHFQMPPSRALLSRIGVAFTIMGVAILVVDYAIQLTFLQWHCSLARPRACPRGRNTTRTGYSSRLRTSGMYCLTSASSSSGLRWCVCRRGSVGCRLGLRGGGALTLVLLVFYSVFYRVRLDYRFEVTAILITWLVLIVAPVLLSIAFRRSRAIEAQQPAELEMSRS